MSRYIITISTTAYKPMRANIKCWERGTVNDFMEALNGYKVTETNLSAVKRRINVFAGHGYCCDNPNNDLTVNEYFEWLRNPQNEAPITFFDRFCGFERTEDISPYGFKQGYFSTEGVINTLKATGKVRIPFECCYDIRQSMAKRFKGCYMEIIKK